MPFLSFRNSETVRLYVNGKGFIFSGSTPSCTPVIGNTFQIGAGTSNSTSAPAYGLYDYSIYGAIWLNTEFSGGEKQFTGIEVEVKGYTSGYTYNNVELWLYEVDQDVFDSTPEVDLSDLTLSNPLLVKTFNWTIGPNGFQTWDFDTNYCYSGNKNLLLIVRNNDGTWSSGYGWGEYDSSPAISRSFYKAADNNFPTGTGTRTNSRINTKFKE